MHADCSLIKMERNVQIVGLQDVAFRHSKWKNKTLLARVASCMA